MPERKPKKSRRPRRRQRGRRPGTAAVAKATNETSAGGVVFRRTDRGPLFLLIRDSYHNWGFPKGHIEPGETSEGAALREVLEETGLDALEARGKIESIDWYFRFRGKLIYKVCDFYLMESRASRTRPQRDEGITACRWLPIAKARAMISYSNARVVLERAETMVGEILNGGKPAAPTSGAA